MQLSIYMYVYICVCMCVCVCVCVCVCGSLTIGILSKSHSDLRLSIFSTTEFNSTAFCARPSCADVLIVYLIYADLNVDKSARSNQLLEPLLYKRVR